MTKLGRHRPFKNSNTVSRRGSALPGLRGWCPETRPSGIPGCDRRSQVGLNWLGDSAPPSIRREQHQPLLDLSRSSGRCVVIER